MTESQSKIRSSIQNAMLDDGPAWKPLSCGEKRNCLSSDLSLPVGKQAAAFDSWAIDLINEFGSLKI